PGHVPRNVIAEAVAVVRLPGDIVSLTERAAARPEVGAVDLISVRTIPGPALSRPAMTRRALAGRAMACRGTRLVRQRAIAGRHIAIGAPHRGDDPLRDESGVLPLGAKFVRAGREAIGIPVIHHRFPGA